MTLEILAFSFGCMLILIGIVGGGMEVKELKVPRVGRPTRIAASGCGVGFIVLGVVLLFVDKPRSSMGPDPPVVQQKGPEQPATSHNSSGSGQVAWPVQNKTSEPPITEHEEPKQAPPPPALVEVTVVNELSPSQISEDVQIYINNQLAANLLVTRQQATASTTIRVPGPGKHVYTLLADGIFVNPFGQMFRQQGRGDGIIEVSQGCTFVCTLTPHGIRLMPR